MRIEILCLDKFDGNIYFNFEFWKFSIWFREDVMQGECIIRDNSLGIAFGEKIFEKSWRLCLKYCKTKECLPEESEDK